MSWDWGQQLVCIEDGEVVVRDCVVWTVLDHEYNTIEPTPDMLAEIRQAYLDAMFWTVWAMCGPARMSGGKVDPPGSLDFGPQILKKVKTKMKLDTRTNCDDIDYSWPIADGTDFTTDAGAARASMWATFEKRRVSTA